MKIVRRTAELENRPWHFGTSETLYRSEMFLIELIGEQEGISVTDAAHHLGITKGAVSQTLKKLDVKGLMEKMDFRVIRINHSVHEIFSAGGLKKTNIVELVDIPNLQS